jgi:type IV secretory pathway VirB10-like protein
VAKPRQPKLKVYQAQFGFYDTVVAAPSQPAALRAWDSHQNLFASGEARLAEDDAAIAAALAHPERPLRRAVGSNDPFQLEATSLPRLPDAPKRAQAKPPAKPRPPPPRRPPADRGALDEAEAALQRLESDRRREEDELRRRQAELDQAKAEAQSAYVEAHRRAAAAVALARDAYRQAGGQD